MVVKKKRVPVSARILEETNAVLLLHAKRNQMSLAELVAHILDDYVVWLVQALKDEEKKKVRGQDGSFDPPPLRGRSNEPL